MFKQELRLIARDINKNKMFWGISLFCLSLAFTISILIWNYIGYHESYDIFHDSANQIYRVVSDYEEDGQLHQKALSPGAVGYYLSENYLQISSFFAMSTLYGPLEIGVGENKFYAEYHYATENICEVLSFNFLEGNGEDFHKPESAIISRSKAKIWFNGQSPLGQSIETIYGTVTVVGVFEDLPANSHFKTDFIIRTYDKWKVNEAWEWPAYYTYLKLKANSQTDEINEGLSIICNERFLPGLKRAHPTTQNARLSLQKLTDIHLKSSREKELEPNGSIQFINNLFWVNLLILLVAITNFVNLYTTQFQHRFKEIGIRYFSGSDKSSIFLSYILRPVILLLISILFAIGVSTFIIPLLQIQFFNIPQPEVTVYIKVMILLVVAIFILSVAYRFAVPQNVAPSQLIQKTRSRFFSLTEMYVIIQFIVSGFLIGTTLVLYKQFIFIEHTGLGMNIDQVLKVRLNSKNYRQSANLCAKLAEIKNVTQTGLASHSPGSANQLQNLELRNSDGELVERQIMYMSVNGGFVPALGIEILQGRNVLDWLQDSIYLEVMVNEAFVETYKITDPIGLTFTSKDYVNGEPLNARIVGVLKDFHFSSLYEKIQPMVFTNLGGNEIFIKTDPSSLKEIFSKLKDFAYEITGVADFQYEFLDQYFVRQYQTEMDRKNLFSVFTALALVIAALGLLATSSKMILSKSREAAIRKTFGSTTLNLIAKYSFRLTLSAVIGFVISIPLIHYYTQDWLSNFAYKTVIGPGIYIITLTSIFLISFLTVLYNSYRVANVNPVRALRINQ